MLSRITTLEQVKLKVVMIREGNRLVSPPPDVDVIIVTYQGKKIISECIQSVLDQDYPRYTCIVIDNNSPDHTGAFVKEHFPAVRVCQRAENLRWPGGLNQGISLGRAKYVLSLNDDIVLSSKNWISELVRILESNPEVGYCVGKMVFYDKPDVIQGAGNMITRSGNGICRGIGAHVDEPPYNQEQDILYGCDAAALFRRDALERIGGADDFLFVYVDVDLGWRFNLAGYKVRYVPQVIAAHHSGYTVGQKPSPKRVFSWTVGRAVVIIKHYELRNLLKYFSWNMIKSTLEFIKHPERAHPILRAWGWILWHFPEILKKRQKIQTLRRVPDAELFQLFAHQAKKRGDDPREI